MSATRIQLVKRTIHSFLARAGFQITKIHVPAPSPSPRPQQRAFERTISSPALMHSGVKLEPLRLTLRDTTPPRVNILLDHHFSELSGGTISNYYLASHLQKEGLRVRLIVLSDTLQSHREKVINEIKQWHGLAEFTDKVEIIGYSGPTQELDANRSDTFLARSWWTAYVAQLTVAQYELRPMIFFEQDYEPIFYPHDWRYAMVLELYSMPKRLIFSSDLLREYFQINNIDVFARPLPDENYCVIENAIPRFRISPEELTRRRTRKLLFFARPSIGRNLFELGIHALMLLVQEGRLAKEEWELACVGANFDDLVFELPGGQTLRNISWRSLNQYLDMLPCFDVGLSLMLSPHPSLVPLDMAAAGLVTVTNTYANKTPGKLCGISSNLIGVPPTISGIRKGLIDAVERVSDVERRVKGAELNWARSWDETFNDQVINKLKSWCE